MRNTQNPKVYLDISIGGDLAERIEIELLADKVPKTAQNFLALCTGEMGLGKCTGKPMYYKGSTFYNIVRGKWAEGGDFSKENGTGGENIYGMPFFDDQGSESKHDEPYLLTTTDDFHKHTFGSRFFITFNELHELDGKHVVFGKVVRGYETVRKIEQVQTFPDGKPKRLVIITACGVCPRQLNSILIRGDSSLHSEERHSRKRKSRGDRIVKHHSESRNNEGDKNSANSASRHSRSNWRDRTYQRPPFLSPVPRPIQSRNVMHPHQQQYTSKSDRSRKNLQREFDPHVKDRSQRKEQNHRPDPETEFTNLSKSMQKRLRLPGDYAHTEDRNSQHSKSPENWSSN